MPQPPTLSLPKGGGGIRSIDDKFQVNAANGTAGLSIPFPLSPSRNGFVPQLSLSYNSGSGNSAFGLGWDASPPAITRKTEKRLPAYHDGSEEDTFLLSGAEDLVPLYLQNEAGEWVRDAATVGELTIFRYRPRIDGAFSLIEKITAPDGDVWWKVTSRDNIVTMFGRSSEARIADPGDGRRIFSWLLEFSYDDKGNCFQLAYKKEDMAAVPASVHEKQRQNGLAPCTNTYLKSVRYGNKTHFKRDTLDLNNWEQSLVAVDYFLELVLDYGEHDNAAPSPGDAGIWLCRTDPFSSYRSGFDIRTYRLCRRLLMFHHFVELGPQPCLVRSLELNYESGTVFSFLKSLTQKGYIRKPDGGYTMKSLPAMDFTYEQSDWDTTVRSLPAESLVHFPAGLADPAFQWTDLYNEGLPGILTEQAGSWYYKNNLGGGRFSAAAQVSPRPRLNGLATGTLRFHDLEGNGLQQLVSYDMGGFFDRPAGDEWAAFQAFPRFPRVDLGDANLKFIDLDGDGRADLLLTEDDVFIWYASEGKAGFSDYRIIPKTKNEEKGPAIVFADATQSIVLADMSGDGLTDIVRIRNTEIVYWPNLGYGKFGAKVVMDNAPVLDHPDHFNARYVKLADINGAGHTDLVYLGRHSFSVYYNQGGNSWSAASVGNNPNPLPFPAIDSLTQVDVIDLLGNGTGCIAWSSALPANATMPLRYIDLMKGKKPFVMTGYQNNMGKEVVLQYKPSTFFYLEDKKNGTPWITKLPFPVQCVSEVTVTDRIAKTHFSNQYSYHHGYYDHLEREFRGFGRVEQRDTQRFEDFKQQVQEGGGTQVVESDFFQSPVLTKTWFHTGAFTEGGNIFSQFEAEYYRNAAFPEKILAEPELPAALSTGEKQEAHRACKGIPLRTEVYALDGSGKESIPFTASRHTCLLRLMQPRLGNKYSVWMVQESEALTYAFEREPGDPRISHTMNIEVDAFGNVLLGAAIQYGRKSADPMLLADEQSEQAKTHVLLTQNTFTNNLSTNDDYRLPLLYETRTSELTGVMPAADGYYTMADIRSNSAQAAVVPYEQQPAGGQPEKRLVEHQLSLFLRNDLSGLLSAGVMESLALPGQSYRLALTPSMLQLLFGDRIIEENLLAEGGYVMPDNVNYWVPSSMQVLDAAHFYEVVEIMDPFGQVTKMSYDPGTHFYVRQITDALGSITTVDGFNFRTLSPYLLKDVNGNRTAVRMDELGMLHSSFVMGKAGEQKGDLLDESTVEISAEDQPGSILAYDLYRFQQMGQPGCIHTRTRETHYYDDGGASPVWQETYTYSSGGGEVIMQKVQAEPGKALREDGSGGVEEVDADPRWVGNGRTIIDNKGNPVKQYEPYFSTTHEFEAARELVERGVSPVSRYDPLGRLIRTDLPDGTFIKTEFDAWRLKQYDQNDTVRDSAWYHQRVNRLIDQELLGEGKDPEQEQLAAGKAALHHDTPLTAYLDALGRNFLSVADNAGKGKQKTLTVMDIEGNPLRIIDARGNTVMRYAYNMLGSALYQYSMDAGERRTFNDVAGKPRRSWDNRRHAFRYAYDVLQRPLGSWVSIAGRAEVLVEKVTYGETLSDAAAFNLLGKPYQLCDAAGMVTNTAFDFKGNLLTSHRQLCKGYGAIADWAGDGPEMAPGEYPNAIAYDALNRPVQLVMPDASVLIPAYNKAGLLEQVTARLRGAEPQVPFVKDISYDVKGQRVSILYGNDTKTRYRYCKKTFRLTELLTTGNNGTETLQHLRYTYDPVGNISNRKDAAQQTLFFNNQVVAPSGDYTYDALYQLIAATGREHIGQHRPSSHSDAERLNHPLPGDGAAMRNYTQSYAYDAVGNILQMIHQAGSAGWTRAYGYAADSNRLNSHTIGDTTEQFTYDAHGNILNQAHLGGLEWNYKDQLTKVDLGGGGKAYYVYDAGGQRIRKVIERPGGGKEERLYLGGYEVYRKTDSTGEVQEETTTLHVMDDTRRIALVETKIVRDGTPLAFPEVLIRYQYADHLGSSSLELDDRAKIISYEEYHPYGTTAYQAMNTSIAAAAKRYRYTGMERDEETGLAYHSARYYLPWLGRWLSSDPIGIEGGMNVFGFCHGNPIKWKDPSGKESVEDDLERYQGLRWLYNYIYFSQHAPTRGQVVATIKKAGGYEAMKQYGFDDDYIFSQNKRTRESFKTAFEKYEGDFISTYGKDVAARLGGPDYVQRMKALTEGDAVAMAEYQRQLHTNAIRIQQYGLIRQSPIAAGTTMAIARQFTDDETKITAWGAFAAGIVPVAAAKMVHIASKGGGPRLPPIVPSESPGPQTNIPKPWFAKIIASTPNYIIYKPWRGAARIRFRASEATTLKEATEGRNLTTDASASLTEKGEVFVIEGRHRAIGSAKGDNIERALGGIAPGVLDYLFKSSVETGSRVYVRDLSIDYSQLDMSKKQADRVRDYLNKKK